MRGSFEKTVIAVAQMSSGPDVGKNLSTCLSLISKAAARGCSMIFLPECCDFVSRSRDEASALAQPIHGPRADFVNAISSAAKEHSIWISLGGMHEAPSPERDGHGPAKLRNAHVIVDDTGAVVSIYRKIHLFDAVGLKESSFTERGTDLVACAGTPCGTVGLGVCYDLRFPLFSRALATAKLDAPVSMLTFPSAFTKDTGAAHWDVLLRARAIENQCYVVAAAQSGPHEGTQRASFGRACIVDPWGDVIASCGAVPGEALATAEVESERIKAIKGVMPVLDHEASCREAYGRGVRVDGIADSRR